jgi:DNA helicase-2/ATP-dependent DNA helicase PcrA
VVGDDDQSIYQFRGADVQNIITFQKRYPKAAIHQLDINRRSSDAIVKTADELIKLNNPERLKKSIKDKGLKSEKGDLYKILFQTQEEEIEWIVEKVQGLVGKEFLDGSTESITLTVSSCRSMKRLTLLDTWKTKRNLILRTSRRQQLFV